MGPLHWGWEVWTGAVLSGLKLDGKDEKSYLSPKTPFLSKTCFDGLIAKHRIFLILWEQNTAYFWWLYCGIQWCFNLAVFIWKGNTVTQHLFQVHHQFVLNSLGPFWSVNVCYKDVVTWINRSKENQTVRVPFKLRKLHSIIQTYVVFLKSWAHMKNMFFGQWSFSKITGLVIWVHNCAWNPEYLFPKCRL